MHQEKTKHMKIVNVAQPNYLIVVVIILTIVILFFIIIALRNIELIQVNAQMIHHFAGFF